VGLKERRGAAGNVGTIRILLQDTGTVPMRVEEREEERKKKRKGKGERKGDYKATSK